ncbi:unnamed protein product [Rotaria sp. Silwood1]|nr:unnamed protein product [Rotaria sp. Silwood1]
MIVSGRLGREIVPSIHQLQQIILIYVYCSDKESHKAWADKFSKVKAVVDDSNELISRIEVDHKTQKMVEESMTINFFTDADKSMTGLNGKFVFSQILIDCLLRLKYTPVDKKELIYRCKQECKGNKKQLDYLHEFEIDYSPNKVLLWYTRQSFFFKTLNAALRTEDFHLMFLFRAYILDIYDQLKKCQSKNPLRVYRGQKMSNDELQNLKRRLNQFISVNSFFSTSTNKNVALPFLNIDDTTDKLVPVLYEIDADPNKVTGKPFADISAYSEFPGESEILFMPGSIFRLNSFNRSGDDPYWIIRMTLCSDDEHDLKQVLMYMKQQLGNGETNLRTLGKVLWKMGKVDLAKQYFNRLLNELSSNDPLLSTLYDDLGELESQIGDFNMSIQWYQKSAEFKSQNQLTSTSSVNEASNSVVPLRASSIDIHPNAKWSQNGITVVGRNEYGSGTNQLRYPRGLYIDDDQTIYVADYGNHRIVEWKYGATNGKVIAGGNGPGNEANQLNHPRDVIVDKERDSLIISDWGNNRVVRWPRQDSASGETIISNIACFGLTMDENGSLYIVDDIKHEVRRYKIGDTEGTVVAGGNGQGNRLDQLSNPCYIFVDRNHLVYVSDFGNDRVMKWEEDAKQGTVVAGGQGEGDSLTQLYCPEGVVVDQLGTVDVADSVNYRIMRWPKEATQGTVIGGGNGEGTQSNQLGNPIGLSFDRQGNLYIVDNNNHRVQKFDIQ